MGNTVSIGKHKKIGRRQIVSEIKWLSLIVPALAFYLIFLIIPSASTIYYSFTDWNGITSEFIGFDNYLRILDDGLVLKSLKNTALYTIFISLFQNIFGLTLAVLLDKKMKGGKLLTLIFFMPAIFSPLVMGYIWGFILQPNFGIVNTILGNLGLVNWQLDWIGNPAISVWMIILISVWQHMGYSMVIYAAGLKAIPSDLTEAGKIDGCSPWQEFYHIKLPLIAPSITINLTLCLIGTLRLFDRIVALTGGGPAYQSESLATMIYKVSFDMSGELWGYGTALSVVMFFLVTLLTFVQVGILRKREVEF